MSRRWALALLATIPSSRLTKSQTIAANRLIKLFEKYPEVKDMVSRRRRRRPHKVYKTKKVHKK